MSNYQVPKRGVQVIGPKLVKRFSQLSTGVQVIGSKDFLKKWAITKVPSTKVPKRGVQVIQWKDFLSWFLAFLFLGIFVPERENMLGHHFADTAAVKILHCSVYKVLPHGAASEAVLKMLPHGASEAVKWFLKACWRFNSGGGDATQLGSILFFKNVQGEMFSSRNCGKKCKIFFKNVLGKNVGKFSPRNCPLFGREAGSSSSGGRWTESCRIWFFALALNISSTSSLNVELKVARFALNFSSTWNCPNLHLKCVIWKSKHRKNCECCPRHPLIKGHNVIVNIVVLNCQKNNQCLKSQVSGHKYRGLPFEGVL